MNFLSLWLVMITFSDMFSISGSIIKICLDWKVSNLLIRYFFFQSLLQVFPQGIIL